MKIKILDGDKIKVENIVDIKEFVEKNEYTFRNGMEKEISKRIADYFMKKYGNEIVEKLKDKMLTEWVEVFKSKVLQEALKRVMEPDRDY